MSRFSRSCQKIAIFRVFAIFCWAPFYHLTYSNTWIFQCHQSLRFLQLQVFAVFAAECKLGHLSRRTGKGRTPCSPSTPQGKPLKVTSLFCTAHHLLRISLRRQKLHVPPPSAPLAPLPRARVPSSRHLFNACHAGYVKSGSDLYRSPELLQQGSRL